jgi:hypothetical protein
LHRMAEYTNPKLETIWVLIIWRKLLDFMLF